MAVMFQQRSHVRVPYSGTFNERKQTIIDLALVNDATYSIPGMREILTGDTEPNTPAVSRFS